MKILLLIAAFAIVPSAHADVSDSGNLSIGGNGVIFGSMTVMGPIAASSVTLSSSGAGAYDLTTATGIHVLSGAIKLESGSYVQWADGSMSTTAASGGSGNVILTATQTFTGGNTFTQSSTFTGTAYFSQASLQMSTYTAAYFSISGSNASNYICVAGSTLKAGDNVVFDMSDQAPPAFGATKGSGEWKDLEDFLANPTDISGAQQKLEADAVKDYTTS